jgi:4-hydroxybenzoate polyprenyltransferase
MDLASAVADHLGLFDSVLSSNKSNNLRGREKLAAIQRHAAGRSYGYVGNGAIDLPILATADVAFIAGPNAERIRKRLPDGISVEIYAERSGRQDDYIRLMRPRHWLKNFLLFIPLIASQQLSELSAVGTSIIAFVAFSLIASANYAINDVFDVHADRRHPVKAGRPIAASRISIPSAVIFSLVLLGLGFAIAAFLPIGFQVTLAGYLCLSLVYSLALRGLLLLDVVTLAAVFVLRIVAGAEAIEVTTSFWLLAFSLFFFASLALTKRCSELHNLEVGGHAYTYNRAYRVDDFVILQTIGVATGVVSVLVLAFYIQDPASSAVYSRPEILWLMTPLLLYWISRIWIKAGRGELGGDPLLFASTDSASWVVMILAMAVILVAM